MFTLKNTTMTTLITPQDHNVDDYLQRFLGYAKPGTWVYFSEFGLTHPYFFQGIKAAKARGCKIKGLVDESEAIRGVEIKLIADLKASLAKGEVLQGTTAFGHQILHLKTCIINLQEPGHDDDIPDADFADWEEAAKAGYPVTWSGSWNYTTSASKQSNNVDLVPSKLRARAFANAIDIDYNWIAQNQGKYNP